MFHQDGHTVAETLALSGFWFHLVAEPFSSPNTGIVALWKFYIVYVAVGKSNFLQVKYGKLTELGGKLATFVHQTVPISTLRWSNITMQHSTHLLIFWGTLLFHLKHVWLKEPRACWCQSDLCERACWCLCRVPLQGVAAGRVQGAGAGCHCQRVPVSKGASVKGCQCQRVPLSKGCLHLRNLDAATVYCCQSAVCVMRGWLRDVYGSVGIGPWWRLRLCLSKKGERLVATKKYLLLSGAYAGVI